MSESITLIGKVKVHIRCRSCHSVMVSRTCTVDDDTSLWLLTERCIVCGWEYQVDNVKAGV